MDELLREFVLERESMNSEGNIYIGSIRNRGAILIFPKQSISKDALPEILLLPKEVIQANDVYSSYGVATSVNIHFRVIYPATDEHVKKYCSRNMYIRETYEDYLKFMDQSVHIGSNWIENIANSTQDDVAEQVLHSDDDVIIVPDYKWDHRSKNSIHLLAIFRDPRLRTIRDIRDHKVLVAAQEKIGNVLATFDLNLGDVFMFFHYRPTYYRLHLHVLNIRVCHEGLASAIRAIPLYDVIHNLQNNSDYYKRDMFVLINES